MSNASSASSQSPRPQPGSNNASESKAPESKAQVMEDSQPPATTVSGSVDTTRESVRPVPRASRQRRAEDINPPAPTIDSVRELLLGDAIKQSQRELSAVERKTHDQLGELRVEMGDRIDRIVRELSTVNQAVHKEFGAREQAVRDSAESLNSKMEERLNALETKMITVVADAERKAAESQSADKDKLIASLAASNAQTEARITELTQKFEQQLKVFGSRLTTEIAGVGAEIEAAQMSAGNELASIDGKVGERLGSVETQMTQDIEALRVEIGKSTAEIRGEMKTQASEQTASIARNEAKTQAKLREHLQQLEGRKVSRNDFSTLLHELAARMDEEDSQQNG